MMASPLFKNKLESNMEHILKKVFELLNKGNEASTKELVKQIKILAKSDSTKDAVFDTFIGPFRYVLPKNKMELIMLVYDRIADHIFQELENNMVFIGDDFRDNFSEMENFWDYVTKKNRADMETFWPRMILAGILGCGEDVTDIKQLLVAIEMQAKETGTINMADFCISILPSYSTFIKLFIKEAVAPGNINENMDDLTMIMKSIDASQNVSEFVQKVHDAIIPEGTIEERTLQEKLAEVHVDDICKIVEDYDPYFKVTKQLHTGSYYDGTKISKLDEFDSLEVLAMSKDVVIETGCSRGHFHIRVPDDVKHHLRKQEEEYAKSKGRPVIEPLGIVNQNNHISSYVMVKYLRTVISRHGLTPITFMPNANIELQGGGGFCSYSLDVTFCLQMDRYNPNHKIVFDELPELSEGNISCVLVPKSLQKCELGHYCWPVSCSTHEQGLVTSMSPNHVTIQMTLKLVTRTLVNHMLHMCALARGHYMDDSYILKMIVLHHDKRCDVKHQPGSLGMCFKQICAEMSDLFGADVFSVKTEHERLVLFVRFHLMKNKLSDKLSECTKNTNPLVSMGVSTAEFSSVDDIIKKMSSQERMKLKEEYMKDELFRSALEILVPFQPISANSPITSDVWPGYLAIIPCLMSTDTQKILESIFREHHHYARTRLDDISLPFRNVLKKYVTTASFQCIMSVRAAVFLLQRIINELENKTTRPMLQDIPLD
ncbi:unnamed protein product [Owenia fusiformis]|uniref:Uncharacterized protein n=1 Tax=Owenia fusiformis TaxID=6347 RepID=A0A8J1XVG1_OWEFU|nr:unnamed protein product [Owenia fusiformis]